MDQRTRRSPGRWLAPLALIAVVVAFASVVSGSGSKNSSETSTAGSQTTTTHHSAKKRAATKSAKAASGGSRYYTVQVGDSLSAIATKTSVPLATIEQLNPNVDSTQMTAGQKIRIK